MRALEEKRVYDQLELITGRMAKIGKGDVIVGALAALVPATGLRDILFWSAIAFAHSSSLLCEGAGGASSTNAPKETGTVMSRDWKYFTMADRTLTVGLVWDPLRSAVR